MKDRLISKGIDLTHYSTKKSAADIEDLRKVLGIEKWNLWGISYSCRLMLEVIRRYPGGVRVAILDSPLPPDVSWDETSIERYWENFGRLTSACDADSAVRSSYPDLQIRFLKLVEEADDDPLNISIKHPLTGSECYSQA
jgi:pimeloyl-ACP methyl ester carboxylesterase